jgi:hypothetical protein
VTPSKAVPARPFHGQRPCVPDPPAELGGYLPPVVWFVGERAIAVQRAIEGRWCCKPPTRARHWSGWPGGVMRKGIRFDLCGL